ncbi:MAG: GNAT family N-acetyltransferase, partial [Campylobacterota bacterium]|nr:GNAT family N-acetyltransferase [Campylobacterota bacterium]
SLVSAKIPFVVNESKCKEQFNEGEYKKDFKKLKMTLSNMGVTVPTLYKQYSELCEKGGIKFCAFNIDPDFSDCIDSFIVVDIKKIKEAQRKRYIDNNL